MFHSQALFCNRHFKARVGLNRLYSKFSPAPPQFTSFVILVVSAGGLHGNTAAGAPPACLAFTVPTLLSHGALAVPVTQVRTAVCEEREGGERGKGGERKKKKRGRDDGRVMLVCLIIKDTQMKTHTLIWSEQTNEPRSEFINHMVARSKY